MKRIKSIICALLAALMIFAVQTACFAQEEGEISASLSPSIISNGFSIDSSDIYAGSSFKLKFSLKNTSSDIDVRNVNIRLSGADAFTVKNDTDELPLIFRGADKKERRERALEMLRLVGIENRADHKPNEMSGGQQQRVGIARAFVSSPKVIFADEPTGNLDSKTTNEVMTLITDLVHKNNQTMVLVTHDINVAAFADITVNISDGRIVSVCENEKEKSNEKD